MPRKPQQDRAVQTRQRIVEAALRAFSERGYDATSVRDIAAGLGLNHAMITYYFGSKEQLWRDSVAFLFERLRSETAPQPGDDGSDSRSRFRTFIRRYVAYCARHPEHGRLMVQESMHDNPRIEWAAREFILVGHQRIIPMLNDLIADGALPAVPVVTLLYVLNAAAQAPFLLAPEIAHSHGADVLAPAAIEAHADIVLRLLLRD